MIIEVIESVSIYESVHPLMRVLTILKLILRMLPTNMAVYHDLIQLNVQCFLHLFVDDLTGYSYFVIPNAFLITLT